MAASLYVTFDYNGGTDSSGRTTEPDSSLGKDGDLYILYTE